MTYLSLDTHHSSSFFVNHRKHRESQLLASALNSNIDRLIFFHHDIESIYYITPCVGLIFLYGDYNVARSDSGKFRRTTRSHARKCIGYNSSDTGNKYHHNKGDKYIHRSTRKENKYLLPTSFVVKCPRIVSGFFGVFAFHCAESTYRNCPD